MDIELVNQELNFHSPDNNLIIKGGCDLFTTKPISTDKKLFKTIDKHLDQMLEDHQLSRSIERKQSVNSLFGSSASPPRPNFALRRGSHVSLTERERRASNSLFTFNKSNEFVSHPQSPGPGSYLSLSLLEQHMDDSSAIEESPFGPLKNVSTRKTFAYLIAILNTTYPDHDFSNLQPTTENFHRVESPETLMMQFNNIMVSLGKKEDLLSWIWDTVNVYMDVFPSRSPNLSAQSSSRKNSFSNGAVAMSPKTDYLMNMDPGCKIYEFRPSDQSILEDLNHPYQTLWSYYWFIYNKKKKRVCFLYLTGLNRLHYSQVNENADRLDDNDKLDHPMHKNDEDSDDFMEEDPGNDDNDDVLGDIEI